MSIFDHNLHFVFSVLVFFLHGIDYDSKLCSPWTNITIRALYEIKKHVEVLCTVPESRVGRWDTWWFFLCTYSGYQPGRWGWTEQYCL